ncbi:MAG: cytochrome C [Acidobacteria bacterium]|nr:MAG: cytochrome C [Acidobacteriota bacterium]
MKRNIQLTTLFAFTLAAVLVCVADFSARGQKVKADDDEASKIERGFAIAPVPLNLAGKNRALVGLGSYIVNAQGSCNECHTNPSFKFGGNPFLGQPEQVNTDGYLAGGQAFGPFISRNLTPNAEGLPAGLTFDQFRHIIRTGADDDKLPPNAPSYDHDLLQVMPWPVFSKMTDRDLRAIYEYLSAIPSRPGYPQ